MPTLTEAFLQDHRRIVALLHRLADEGPLDDVVAAVADRLLTHIHAEEELVFPAVISAGGDAGVALTTSLRREHGSLRELLGEISASVAAGDTAATQGNLRELAAAFAVHERREEQVLYPLLDQLLSAAAAEQLSAFLDASAC